MTDSSVAFFRQAPVWFLYAESDLRLAEIHQMDGEFLRHVCFHSQQAVEMYLKGFIFQRGAAAPRTHDLIVLCEICALLEDDFEPWDTEIARMTDYAVSIRYPLGIIATVDMARRAVAAARHVKQIIERKMPS